MLLPPAHACAPVEPVGECAEVRPAGPVAERCDDRGCDEEVFGADAERDRVRGAGGAPDRHPFPSTEAHEYHPTIRLMSS